MARDSEVRARTQQFAEKIADLLNGTVAHSASFHAALLSAEQAAFGTMNPRKLNDRSQAVRLETRGHFAHLWLDFGFTMFLNVNNHLTVESSIMAVLTGPEVEHQLFRYDYERNKKDGFPEAHLQVCTESQPMKDLLTAVGRSRQSVEDLHFPVGGRRYRPPLEDIIEFLIREKIVAERSTAQAVINRHREEFRRIQLKAAIKSDVPSAIEALGDEGYDVTPKKPPGKLSKMIPIRRGRAGR